MNRKTKRRIISKYMQRFFWSISLFSLFITSLQAQSVRNDGQLFTYLEPERTNIHFSNDIPETQHLNILTYEYLHNGGGVAVGDLDNDGIPEIFFTGNFVDNQLYKMNGDMTYEEIASNAGVLGTQGWDTGVTMVDINNDGYLDIYIGRSGPLSPELRANELYINNGDMTFTERAAEYGLDDQGYATQAVFFDYNGDGLLDMYLLNHNIQPMEGFDPAEVVVQRHPYAGDKLYKNTGEGYVDVSEEAGIIGNPVGYGLGVAVGDINNDGHPDIYVGNDFLERDYLYINNGDGTFTEKLKDAMPHTVQFSMGNDIADFNNDGWLDLLVTDMIAEDNYRQKTNMTGMDPTTFGYMIEDGFHYQYMINTLQMNNGNETFSDVGQLAGISNTDWSWAALMTDFDNDGFKDIFIANGYYKEVADKDYNVFEDEVLDRIRSNESLSIIDFMGELLDSIPSTPIENYIFRNNGDLTFTKKIEEWGMNQSGFSTGAAYADLNGDGALDLVVNNVNGKPFVYLNNGTEGNYLRIKLNGPDTNRSGLGSRVTIHTDHGQQMIEHYMSRGFQSSAEDVLHFGLGEIGEVDELNIRWPDGKVQTLQNISANKILTLNYNDASEEPKEPVENRTTLFEDITEKAGLNHRHRENEYVDFERQPLLPHKLSKLGPGIAIGDVNGDGLEDFYIGGAHGESGTLYLQDENETFRASDSQPWEADRQSEDMGAAFFDANGDGSPDLYVVSGGYEFEPDADELRDRLYLNDGGGGFEKATGALPEMLTSGSVVVPGDYNGDGQTDLFVGGRVFPGNYPEAPRSYILQNNQGQFSDVTYDIAPELSEAGMVTDAIWTDYDNDGVQDLIVVGEWMPILIMENREGEFRNVTAESGLSESSGWWFSIAEAGLNENGGMDYIAGNLGLNYRYKTSEEEPFQIFSNDFDEDGAREIVLGYYNDGNLYPRAGKEALEREIPFLEERAPTFHEFGLSTLTDLFEEQLLNESLHYQAKTFETSYLANNGDDGIDRIPLPNMAQISAVKGIISDDFDGDGIRDFLIAGNFYATHSRTPRNDAGIGLFLKEESDGYLMPVPATESGFYAGGDVKGLAVIKLGRRQSTGILIPKNDDFLQLIKVNSLPGN